MTPDVQEKLCWCCRQRTGNYDSGLCISCWSWADYQMTNDSTEEQIREAWENAHPDEVVPENYCLTHDTTRQQCGCAA